MTMILPSYNVNASISGNDGINYPDKPDDGNDGYIIGYFWKYNQWNQAVYTTRLITFNTEETKYISTGYWSNGVYLNLYKKPVCSDGQSNYTDVCTTSITEDNYSNSISYTYDSSNNSWVLENESGARQYFRATKIYYSTADIYYRRDSAKSTYPDNSYFISGEHNVPTKHPDTGLTLQGLESSYYDMTYEHNTPSLDFVTIEDKQINDYGQAYHKVNIDINGKSIFLHKEYKTRVKTDIRDWIYLTEEFNVIDWANGETTEDKHYHMYLTYNTNITFQVLDMYDNVVYEEIKTINDLNEFNDFIITPNLTPHSSGLMLYLLDVDASYIFSEEYEYYYSFDLSTWHKMTFTEEDKHFDIPYAFNTNIYFRVDEMVEINGESGWSTFKEQTYFLDSDYLERTISFDKRLAADLENNDIIIFDINFYEYYVFKENFDIRILVNNEELTEEHYIKEISAENFDTLSDFEIKIYIDEFLLSGFVYSYKNGAMDTFEEEFGSIIGNELESETNKYVDAIFKPILDKFPIIIQIKEIIDNFEVKDFENTEPPNFTINFSFLGVDKDLKVIDFSLFTDYRDFAFEIEKMFLGAYTFTAVIRKIKNIADNL